jgi:signal transduction histidine kinase
LIVQKGRSPVRLRRRAHGPLAVAFVGLIAGYVLYQAVEPSHPGTTETFRIVLAITSLAAPAAILFGQIWGSVSVATGLGQISLDAGRAPLDPRRMQGLIGDALGDPTLRLALWRRERAGYVDVDEEPLSLPTGERSRGVTLVKRDGAPVAALVHAPDLDVDPEVVDALAATSLLLLENTRLVEELRASRARIVDTAEKERLRLERDLHDGAQQRLLTIEIKLSLARKRVADADVGRLLDEIGMDAVAAHEELLALAHGIYPTVLRERGLAEALRAASKSASLPVDVEATGVGRCPPTVEAALYFWCLEAIQNAGKHAGAGSRVTVTLGRHESTLDFEVSDDGGGIGPETSSGMGLTSMRDRIGAVGGELEILSSNSGTIVRGSVPTGD